MQGFYTCKVFTLARFLHLQGFYTCNVFTLARFLHLQAIKCRECTTFYQAHQFWVSPLTSRSVRLHWKEKFALPFLLLWELQPAQCVCNTLWVHQNFSCWCKPLHHKFFQLYPINASEQITCIYATFFETKMCEHQILLRLNFFPKSKSPGFPHCYSTFLKGRHDPDLKSNIELICP